MTADVLIEVARLLSDERFGARITVLTGPEAGVSAAVEAGSGLVAGLLPETLAEAMMSDAQELITHETPATLSYDGVDVFIEPVLPRPRLVVFGAVHIAQALADHASLLGYHVTVSDARAAFLTSERFPKADQLARGWPDEVMSRLVLDQRTSVVVLSHDARFEDPLWPLLLPHPVAYIGAMGSRKTAGRRRERLLSSGFDPAAVDKIRGPVGLDIGADTPGEVAVAILAEIISVRRRPVDTDRLQGELVGLVSRDP